MTTRIVVTVRTDGTISAETHGVKGPACLDEVSRIEALCGGRVAESNLTAEYYEVAPVTLELDERVNDNGDDR